MLWLLLLVFVGCINQPVEETKDVIELTMDEVAKHNRQGDCWMVIEGNVYELSYFTEKHPGGNVILNYCGKDGTEMFYKRPHSPKAVMLLQNFYLGKLNQTLSRERYLSMRERMERFAKNLILEDD